MKEIYLLLIGLLMGIVLTWLFEFVLKNNKKLHEKYYKHHKLFWGYHIHHSTYGLIFILLNIILFLYDHKASDFFYTALGVGVILMHTASDGKFVFIEKQRK